MKPMKAKEIREKFLQYFKKNDHAIIDSAPVIPENDNTVLFTSAGMQQLVPYLMGKKHPKGRKLADYQKCVRTVDIDEVGNNRHLTFFEMLGFWSLGAYFKKESIHHSYNVLTKVLEIPHEKLSVTCFEGDEDAPRDEESAEIWREIGIPEEKIYYFGKSENWWIAGDVGPCGPDTEIFYDMGTKPCSKDCNPSCDCGKYVEIWNNVFMEYYKDENGYTPLKQKNVDTGMGLERIAMILQNKETPYDLEIFSPTIDKLKKLATKDQKENIESMRIIADHLRTVSIIIADGGEPSNTDRGYILRRLLRRAIRHVLKLEISEDKILDIINVVIETSSDLYPEIGEAKERILEIVEEEKNKFVTTLHKGEREFEKIYEQIQKEQRNNITVEEVFMLYERFGLPPEITAEMAREKELEVELDKIDELFKKHQEASKGEGIFKGGLADDSEKTIKYHTATHLLHKALQKVLGEHAIQKGSNITSERLRFDFANPEKVSKEDLQKIEDMVNEVIDAKLDITYKEMSLEEAKKLGAIGLFEAKYDDKVRVYKIGDFSLEVCGGPHVNNTKELGKFKIKKEQASSKGVRRIRAVLIDEDKEK